jgi:hypothetical protein
VVHRSVEHYAIKRSRECVASPLDGVERATHELDCAGDGQSACHGALARSRLRDTTMRRDRSLIRARWARWILVLLSPVACGCTRPTPADATTGREKGSPMAEKLDPRLLDMVQHADAGHGDSAATVDVLVAVDAPIDAAARGDLTARGLNLRSEVGTVLTGSIRVGDVNRLAASSRVVKIEASAPLYREPSGGEG